MKVFEIRQWSSEVSDGTAPFVPDGATGYVMSDDAEEALDEILGTYENSSWYLDQLQHRWPGGPWSFVCLDREYALAAHVVETRQEGVDLSADIGFVPLARTPKPVPPDYCPGVGILAFRSKETAKIMATRSRLFESAWVALKDLRENRHWLVLLGALEQDWVDQASQNNRERWVSSRIAG